MNLENTSLWETLPDIVLSNVLKHLDDKDRFSASLVSKAWLRAFKHPQLWRKLKTVQQFPKYPAISSEKPIKFLRSNLGQYLQNLDIDCSTSGTTNVQSMCNFLVLLDTLTKKQISLRKLNISNLLVWKNDYRYRRRNVEKLIHNLLGTLTNLEHFDMKSCKASLDIGVDFLNQLSKNNSSCLKNLHLLDFFSSRCEVLSSTPYKDVIGSFRSLVHVTVNYGLIDSNILRQIVENCYGSLEIVKICYTESDEKNDHHLIPNSTWEWARTKCPRLEIHFEIVENPGFSDYSHLIPPEMRLCKFEASDYQFDIDGLELNRLMTQLIQFRETLVELNLNFWSNGNFEERLVIELVSSCRALKRFRFYILYCIETALTLCQLQKDGDIHLEFLHLTICEEFDEGEITSDLRKLIRSVFEDQGIQIQVFCFSEDFENIIQI